MQSLIEKHPFVDPAFGEFTTAMPLRNANDADRTPLLTQKYQFIRRINDAGVRLTAGTDAPWWGMDPDCTMNRRTSPARGFHASEILRSVTQNNADYLGKGDSLGQIAPGFFADLVLVGDNPLQNLATPFTNLGHARRPNRVSCAVRKMTDR